MSKIAVIRTGGKQYLVKAGDVLKVEKLSGPGATEVSDVLMVASDDGQEFKLGAPLTGTKVQVSVVGQGRADKVRVVHYKPKVRHHKVYGHRQPFTELKVGTIG